MEAELVRTTIWQADPLEILARWRDDWGDEFDALHAADGKPLVSNKHFKAPHMTSDQIVTATAAGDVFAREPLLDEDTPPLPSASSPGVSSPHPAYELADQGAAAKPELAERMQKAADLVAAGKVKLHDANPLGVIGTVEGYSIYEQHCSCADHQYRGGWCKHRLAVRMARALKQAPEPIPATSDAAVRERQRAEKQRIAREVRDFNRRDQESWRAYCQSQYGSQRYTIKAVANGATTLPPEKWRKAWGGRDLLTEEYEL